LLYRRSLRVNFLLKLVVAMATLVLITSSSLYIYLKLSANYELEKSLEEQANYLLKNYYELDRTIKSQKQILKSTLDIEARIERAPYMHYKPKFFRIIKESKKYFIQGFFPYNFQTQTYLILTKDITRQVHLQKKVYKAVVFTNIASLIFIIIYAFFISKMLIKPITLVSKKIAKMNEQKLNKIDSKKLPIEFEPLVKSINQLIAKVESFIKYKKDLFIGAAHELKTPLAVMKTKSQVALLKKDKNIDTLTQAIKQNIESVNNLNAIIESILAFGRAEGAQFEEAKKIDIIRYFEAILDEFEIIAIKEEKFIARKIFIKSFEIKIQPLLFRQIIQNFLQNALRFTKKGDRIYASAFVCNNNLVIRIKDKGEGLPKDFDIFAPFKRSKSSPGTGLGLFLAKNAADSLGAKIGLKNRKYGGVIATFILPISTH